MLRGIAGGLTRWSTRWVPDAFVIAVILSVIVFVLTLVFTGKGVDVVVKAWGQGFWVLLEFAMQMSLIILTGYVVATSPPFKRFLNWLAGLVHTPTSAIALMAFVSMALSLFNWGLSIVGSATFSRYMVRKNPAVDYRLLIASAYLGLGATWHGGLSASAPLLIATPNHAFVQQWGVIDIGKTIFHPFNIVLVIVSVVLLTIVAPLLHPRREDTVTVTPEQVPPEEPEVARPAQLTPGQWLEHAPIINVVFGVAGLAYLVLYFTDPRTSFPAGVTLNTVNFFFLTLGILLHWTPASLLRAAQEGGTFIWGVVLQFPLYAGMFGMIRGTGFDQQIAQWFTSIATAQTYPVIVYWYSGILNYFVPSGGSKFAIEAPYIAEAAKSLGVPLNVTAIAYAWGDMATDLIQPFWAIPLLGIARLGFRDIMGFLLVMFLIYVVVLSVLFLVGPAVGLLA
ncbi:MAG TPA: TIGR00366 family protein [Candidatus Limnocylindria bacterium]|nr:TIGR00366 family protein [Candidatus Limnocylindria bacterium]